MAEATWYVATSGAATGPFDLARLKQMAAAGALARGDLVYPAGGSEWAAAATVPGLFPPPPRSPRPADEMWERGPEAGGAPGGAGDRTAAAHGPAPGSREFSTKLLGQTAGVWFAVGFCSGWSVHSAGLGVPLVLGAVASVLGAGCVGLLSVTRTADKWYLLRWVNHVLERLAAGAVFGGFVAALLLAVFAGMPVSGPDDRSPGDKALQDLVLRSSTLFGLLAALVCCLVRTWDRTRHVDLPTELNDF